MPTEIPIPSPCDMQSCGCDICSAPEPDCYTITLSDGEGNVVASFIEFDEAVVRRRMQEAAGFCPAAGEVTHAQ